MTGVDQAGPSDADVLARSGEDPAVFAVIYDRYADEVHRFVLRRLGRDLADDITAETFTAPFRHRERFDPGGLSHCVIQVDDVRAAAAHLAERGVQVDEPGSPDGSTDFWTAWVTDPDGYRIELVQWPQGHPTGMTRADLPDPEERR